MILKNGGKIVKNFHISGIDFSGTVLESSNQNLKKAMNYFNWF